MYIKYWQSAITYLVLLVVVGSSLAPWQTRKAYADLPSLNLQIDSPETIRWDIGNIQPGDSGLEPVTLHNTGNATGYLCLWISDVIDGEGVNPESETGNTTEPGELSSYLSLDIINDGMTFARLTGNIHVDVELPISLNNFPGDIDHALCINNPTLKAGQSLELQWKWTLPPDTGNDVQGDTVTFSINYSLISEIPAEYVHPPGPLPPNQVFPVNGENNTVEPTSKAGPPPTSTPLASGNETPAAEPTVQARIYVSDDGRCVINIPEGVPILTDSGNELLSVTIDTPDDIPFTSESLDFASPVYRFLCNTVEGMTEGTQLREGVLLTIHFDADMIPEDAEVSIFGYHTDSGWAKLDCYGDANRGWLSTRVDYLEMAAVLVLSKKSTLPDVVTASPSKNVVPDTRVISDSNVTLRHVSLGIMLSGVVSMAVLAYIQRKRRVRQAANYH
jgi:hypothetical protein